jgi:hypothetical protein
MLQMIRNLPGVKWYCVCLTGFALLLLQSCSVIDPAEKAPAYIAVDTFYFDPVPAQAEMGSSTSTRIRDVWYYLDDEFQGAYELPARFPVLKTGTMRMILKPGIALNGISATRSPYPFYRGLVLDTTVVENGTLSFTPTASYFDSVKCSFCESFDGSGFSMTATTLSDTIMYQLPPGDAQIFEGTSSGVAYLDTDYSIFEITSSSAYDLPGAQTAVFLEFDYKINQPMQAGLFVNFNSAPSEKINIITLNPTDEWKKIYVQLGYTVSAYPTAVSFQVYFGAIKDPDVSQGIFYLDNIKVVHF